MSVDQVKFLNDRLRVEFEGGKVVTTAGVGALPALMQAAVLEKVRTFNQFSADNDPHDEHDFGQFEHEGQNFLWKIDYYDNNMEYGSENPADLAQTTRVLTIMLADEY